MFSSEFMCCLLNFDLLGASKFDVNIFFVFWAILIEAKCILLPDKFIAFKNIIAFRIIFEH